MGKVIRSFFGTGCIFLLMLSCNSNNVYSDYRALDSTWDKDESVDFTFQPPDTVQPYNMFIHLRNDEKYQFSNLFLIVNLSFPDGKVVADTLEYEMAKPDGEWLGQGFTALKENKLWYKEHVVFPVSGNYTVAIKHAMRKVGDVEGLGELEGITDVGIEIEKQDKEQR